MLCKLLRQVTATTSLISVAPCKAFTDNGFNNEIDSVCIALLSIQVHVGQPAFMHLPVLMNVLLNDDLQNLNLSKPLKTIDLLLSKAMNRGVGKNICHCIYVQSLLEEQLGSAQNLCVHFKTEGVKPIAK